MRKISEVTINGRPLQEILDEHKEWWVQPSGEETAKKANLQEADLREANLRGADLRGANLDFSCWPLWCGSKNVKVDKKIAAQLAAHFCVLGCDDPGYIEAAAHIMKFARTSHRAGDLGLL